MDGAAPPPLPGFEGSLALSLVSLGMVCLVAWGVLRLMARRRVGQGDRTLRVVARCTLEPRRTVFVVEAAGRFFLVGVGDGPMAMLAELDEAAVRKAQGDALPALSFAQVLGRRSGAA